MFIQMLLKEKRIAQLFTLLIFLVMAFVFLVVTYVLQVNEDRIIRSEVEITEYDLVQLEKSTIANKIQRRASDVLFVVDSLYLSGEMLSGFNEIERPWIAFSDRYQIYDQIRYIDSSGQEKIRINYSPDGAYAVGQEGLQNKADRYYFTSALTLRKNDIFISKLDLNVENGQIEDPVKPTIRLATPFFWEGALAGVIVLNYNADDMLAQVRAIADASRGEVYLLNVGGYWLYNSADSQTEWAFMYEGREDESFAHAFPVEWEAITAGGDGVLITENGVFTFAVVMPEAEITGNSENALLFDQEDSYYIISYIPGDTAIGLLFAQNLWTILGRVVTQYLSIYFLMTGIAFVLAAFVAVSRAQKKEIKYFSEFDALTGVYNRRAGYRKLNELKKQSSDRGYQIAICFIDVNGLKEVNDSLGHDTGDELIQSVASVIRDSVRGNDFVSRFGGDEFLIVFDRLEESGAEGIWKRITDKFAKINAEEQRPYRISVSHGVGLFVSNGEVSIDGIIARADEKMYEEKRKIKKGLKVIR